MRRRTFLATAGAGLACTALPASGAASPRTARRTRLAVSTYSYWHFRGPKVPVKSVIDDAARLGFDGVEILHRQMTDESPAACNVLKRRAHLNGLDLVMLSTHQGFVHPKEEIRKRNIDHTVKCIELADRLGIPCIRINSGRWGTIRSWNALMEARGVEPPLEGYTEDDGFRWCIESIEKCLPAAEKHGVVLAIENHWGLTTRAEGVLRIRKAIDSPWLGVNLDTGNYVGEPYDEMKRLAPHATIVQAKTYPGGGEWYTLDLDYERIAGILRDAGFTGYVSLEMEGKEPAETAVPKSLAVLRKAFG